MKRFILALMTVTLLISLSLITTNAQVPQIINYQASLMDEENKPVNGNVTITFAIFWDEITGVIPLWAENRSVEAVNGFVNIYLGEIVPINLPFDKPYWLEVKLGDAPAYPRTRLSTVPYAYMSIRTRRADTSIVAESVIDNGVKQNMIDPDVQALPWGPARGHLTGTYPNPTLNLDSLNKLVTLGFVRLNQNAGGALAGQYPNPSIRDTAVTASKIRSNAVTTSKIADLAVTQPKIALSTINVDNIDGHNHIGGPLAPLASAIMWDGSMVYWGFPSPGGGAGGDLGGLYPSPMVTGLRGVPIASVPSPSDNEVYVFRNYGTPSTLDDRYVSQKILPDNLWSYNNTPLGAAEDNYLLSWDWNGGADPRMRWIPPVLTTYSALPIVGDGSPGNPITLNRAGVSSYQVYYMSPTTGSWTYGKLIPQNFLATPASPGAGEDGYVLSWNNSNTMMQWSGVTSAMIVDGTIVDADVNAAAAIAGTKINPDFGSQNIVTLGNISAASGSFTGIVGSASASFTGIDAVLSGNVGSPTANYEGVNANLSGIVGSSSATITGDMLGIGTTTPNNDIQVAGLINFDNSLFGTYLGYQAGNVNAGVNNTFVGYQSGLSNTSGYQNTAHGSFALQANSMGFENTAIGDQALYTNTFGSGNTATGVSALYSNTTASYNTANGAYALFSNLTGAGNSAIGGLALYSNTIGNNNTAIGRVALYSNTLGDQNTANGSNALYNNITGVDNTAIGYNALYLNTSGSNNIAVGSYALQANTTANGNTAVGFSALYSNTTGNQNTANGSSALRSNTTGIDNTSTGYSALYSNTTGSDNTANGNSALQSNTTGNYNTGLGSLALASNTTANYNTAVGFQSLYLNSFGSGNTALGYISLQQNSTGSANTALGYVAMQLNTTGNYNTATGNYSLYSNTTGNNNTAIGNEAGYLNSIGNGNVFLGYQAGYNETGNDKLYIANSSANPPLIYGDFATGDVTFGTIVPGFPSANPDIFVEGNIEADGTIYGTLSGPLANNLTEGVGISAFTYNGSTSATVGIANSGVVNSMILDGTIGLTKFANPGSANNGRIIYWDGSAWRYSEDVAPSNGQILKLSSGTVTWVDDIGFNLPYTYSGNQASNLLNLTNSGAGAILNGTQSGTGYGIYLNLSNTSSTMTGVLVDVDGTGIPGYFLQEDAAGTTDAPAVSAKANSDGTNAVHGFGLGSAIHANNTNTTNNSTGLFVENGRTILSYGTATDPSGGAWNLSNLGYHSVIYLPNNASDGLITLPGTGNNGQLLYIYNSTGGNLSASSHTITSGDVGTFVYANGGWHYASDNLGTHVASRNIHLNSHWLSNDGDNEGISIDNSGNVTLSGNLDVCAGTIYGTVAACPSDIRLKKDIVPLDNALNSILALRGVYFDWNREKYPERNFTDKRQVGFIAQEVEKQYPELVITDKSGYKAVDYSKMTAVLVQAVKQQQEIINSQSVKISNLETNLNEVSQLQEQYKVLQTQYNDLQKMLLKLNDKLQNNIKSTSR